MKKDKRKRKNLQVQVDLGKKGESIVNDYHQAIKMKDVNGIWKEEIVNAMLLRIELRFGGDTQLKKQYPSIYEASRLHESIKRGELSVMKELFPERYEVFRLQMEADILEGINRDTQRDLLKELRDIRSKLDSLQASGIQVTEGGGLKKLDVPQFTVPDYDDDDLIIKQDKNAGQVAANNFLASIKNLQTK